MSYRLQDPAAEGFIARLPLFDGFPYLMTRVVEAMRHIILLPAERSESELRRLAVRQVLANRLETCLVLGADRAIFYTVDGEPSNVTDAPRGNCVVFGKLQPAEEFEQTPEFRSRTRGLEEFHESLRQKGFLVCDARTSRRPATPDELESLVGLRPDGVPRGLAPCPVCGEYRGLSLGSTPASAGWVATVYCHCENHNRCARCGETLAPYRLNGHSFDRQDRMVLHDPAFCAFSHRCPPDAGRIQ